MPLCPKLALGLRMKFAQGSLSELFDPLLLKLLTVLADTCEGNQQRLRVRPEWSEGTLPGL
jgi:hypothetical protein